MSEQFSRRILLVDDMPAIHEDFRKILAPPSAPAGLDVAEAALFGLVPLAAAERFDLDSAYQGREGAQMLEAALRAGRPYSMAFVDMRMPPGWDGVQTVERLWQIDPQLQVVICTAHADHSWEEVLGRLDVRDRLLIVKKPFDMIEVSQLARTLTTKWELARQAQAHLRAMEEAVRELQATEAALRQSNKELAGFAHSLSHDLRSPLGVMSSFSGLLARELGNHDNPKVRHYLSRIQASAALGEQLIEGMLVLDRVSRVPLTVEAVDLSAMARRLLHDLAVGDPRRIVAVAVHDGMCVDADRRLLQIALTQLLDNAWKFTAADATAAIEVGMRDGDDGEPVFFVRDNGCGFDMAYADKLFHIFQRLHTRPDLPGTGVGLVTVSRAIDRHGGRVWAETQAGGGATFFFTLPADAQPQPTHHSRLDSLPGELMP